MKKYILPIILTIIVLVVSPILIKNSMELKSADNCDEITEFASKEVDKDIEQFRTFIKKEYNNAYDFNVDEKTIITKRTDSYYSISIDVVIYDHSLKNISAADLRRAYSWYDTEIFDNVKNIKAEAPIYPDIRYRVFDSNKPLIMYENRYFDYPAKNAKDRSSKAIDTVYLFAAIALLSWVSPIATSLKYRKIDDKKKLFIRKAEKSYINRNNYNQKTDSIKKIAKNIGLKLSINELIELLQPEFEKAKKLDAEKLYEACTKEGITSADSKSDIQRVAIIAKKIYINDSNDDLRNMFNQAKQREIEKENKILADKKEDERRTRLNKMLIDESNHEKENQQFKNLIGISKLKASISHEIALQNSKIEEYKYKINSIKSQYKSAYYAGKQHVPDWAVHGGIASGIAGGAAGAMVAMDVKQRADSAKSQNAMYGAALLLSETEKTSPLYKKIETAEKKIQALNKKLEKVNTLLVENISENILLSEIQPEYSSIEISEVGNAIISISTSAHSLIIFDDVNAVVDGTIEVLLMNEDKEVGTAYFSLPYTGSAKNFKTKVYCTKVTDKVTNVKFRPYHLWAIEKI